MRLIDADALFAVVKGHHDLYNGATNPTDKARRDENLQVMCDITDAPDIDAIPVEWMREKMRGYASTLKSTEMDAVVRVMKMWEKERREKIMINDKPLDAAKKIIEKHYKEFDCGIFDTSNIVGDLMATIYKDDSIEILGCYYYSYFEVFGLSRDDFNELEKYYNSLIEEAR